MADHSKDKALPGIGANIRAARLARGMTQAQLAGGAVTRNMLSRIENGAALPSLPTLCAIASRLDLPAGALIGELDDYTDFLLICELKHLLAKGKYVQLINRFTASGTKHPGDELLELLIRAHLGRADELFAAGRLGESLDMLDTADEFAKKCGYDTSRLREKIYVLRMMIETCPALHAEDTPSSSADVLESRRLFETIIFDNNETAIYLWCRGQLANIAAKPYFEPHESAKALRAELTPLILPLSNELYRGHLLSKLDMADADYLAAKAGLLKLCALPDVPISVLYELYMDLELCCKCCGDFENAYKYSGMRLELIKKIN